MSENIENTDTPDDSSALPISNYALLCLISGILGLTILPIVGSILALIMGSMAKKELDLNWGKFRGDSIVRLGEVLGWVGLGLALLSLCAAGLVVLIAAVVLLFSVDAETINSLIPVIISFL